MPRRSILLFAGAVIAFAVAIAVATIVVVNRRDGALPAAEASTGQPSVGGPFQLVNQDGQAVDQSMLDGKWSLVFFGFTYADYCPRPHELRRPSRSWAPGPTTSDRLLSVDPTRHAPALKDPLSDGFPRE